MMHACRQLCLYALLLSAFSLPWQNFTLAAEAQKTLQQTTSQDQQKKGLDALFARLAKAQTPQEAEAIATLIEHVWAKSNSPTADFILSRVSASLAHKKNETALALLDKLVEIAPNWVEAWNHRAAVRFGLDDDVGSMNDIAEVLKREPRHFNALAGMALILQREHEDKEALKVYRAILTIYPQMRAVNEMVEKLKKKVEGEDI